MIYLEVVISVLGVLGALILIHVIVSFFRSVYIRIEKGYFRFVKMVLVFVLGIVVFILGGDLYIKLLG